jgi:hypothetical protein
MMKLFALMVILISLLPARARADPEQEFRCTTDSLNGPQAIRRLEWARKCALLNNTGGPDSWIESDAALDVETFSTNPPVRVNVKDYVEIDLDHAFTGSVHGYRVNQYHAISLYVDTPTYTVFRELPGSGLTANYYKWSHTTQRPQPRYPSFEDTPRINTGTQLFPHPDLAGCRLYTDRAGTMPYNGNFYLVALCESSCYTPDQRLRFSDGDVSIVEAMTARRDDLITLSPDATLDKLATQTSKVYSYTTEIRDAEQLIYKVTTASGGSLSVTNAHPIITSEGRLVKAEQLVEGDELVKANGSPDRITRVEKTQFFGKVYNIKPMSREPVANILVAQGYLVGSARFQNDDVEYINRILLFRSVPDQVIPK